MKYQDLFQCLKGVGSIDLSDLMLEVEGTDYVLQPVNCCSVDLEVAQMLTAARNENANSFLTFFEATADRTTKWLVDSVSADASRILFVLKNSKTRELYGYMGLAYGDEAGQRIEGDAIVRYSKRIEPGLMKAAFLRLIGWTTKALGFDLICLRVLSDNPAIDFYRKCGFKVVSEVSLYEVNDSAGKIVELTELPGQSRLKMSPRKLMHLNYVPR